MLGRQATGRVPMGWKDEERDRQERATAAVERLAAVIESGARDLRDRERVPEAAVGTPWRLPGLQLALRFCVDVATGDGLANHFRPVPAEYVDREAGTVRCPCGMVHAVTGFSEAECGRWFAGDASGVWAVKLDAPAAA
jgi:hypothetical protein